MISYAPLWNTLQERNMTTYTLRQYKGFGGGTIQRLRKNLSVSTNTLDDLCKILNCPLSDVAMFVDDTTDANL
ncbi:helix-turn-helix transcriptional regulator [Bengtsoniella intestinalis]|uniref:helix-turn-helix domain-containing protein n=1 Tax=Bengtsoniella intestinalis TaxID=3073143 RepID=UPI00391F7E1E